MGHFKKRPAWVPTEFDPGQPTWKPIFYEAGTSLSTMQQKKI